MSKIIKLDKNLANQIAAWEVVERPVSIVKELVENSIDAWAKNISVSIKNWWIDEIIIIDDWYWINKNDLPLTIEKYTTSKIKTLNDLYNIMTFGFRWEALSSISSVSKFEIISREKYENFWTSLKTEWWDNIVVAEVWFEVWTKIIVKDLFFNTPARLNYLKQARTEYNKILDFLNSISLALPNIWFEFISDWRKVFKYKWEKLETRIYNIYWDEFAENLLYIENKIPWFEIKWYLSDPKVSFPNKNRQLLFINNRVVKSPLIYKAIDNAYNRFIPHWNFPAYVLNINIDPTQIDVNVHPRKLEVRFANESNIFRSVFHSIEDKLTWVSLVSDNSFTHSSGLPLKKEEINMTSNNYKWESKQYYTWSWTKFKSYSPYKDITPNPNQSQINDALVFSKELLDDNIDFEKSTDLHDTKIWKIIGQTHNSYIIVETNDWLKILDQHALAERIIYEKLISNSYNPNTQWLLLWETVNLTVNEFLILEKYIDIFLSMWFDFELMSNNIVIINWIPDFVIKEDIWKTFLWIINDIWEEGNIKSKTLDEIRNKIYAYTSCRSAIKFWNKLNLFEMNKLLNDSVITYSSTCPHWRPVVFEITLDEMKDKYER